MDWFCAAVSEHLPQDVYLPLISVCSQEKNKNSVETTIIWDLEKSLPYEFFKKIKNAKKKLHLFNNEAADLKRRKEGRKCKCESINTYSEMQELQALWETFKTIQLHI